jgi:uncharacterized membrane protein (DUF485 family)
VRSTSATNGALLEKLQRRRRGLAWWLSLLTFAVTVGFFAMMGLDLPLLSQVAFGRCITVANVLAASIVLLVLLSIAVFSQLANRIDDLADRQGRLR